MKALQIDEQETPLIPEDIEVGDRLYYKMYLGQIQFGEVKSISSDQIFVELDDGEAKFIKAEFGSTLTEGLKIWGKPLPLAEIVHGSRISVLDTYEEFWVKRFYATVVDYIPDFSITVVYDDDPDYPATFLSDIEHGRTLEATMKYWELEE
jgi:hypothetical protein